MKKQTENPIQVKEEHPILKRFLSDRKNYILVQNAIKFPTDVNKDKVDHAFKEYYYKAKLYKYVATIINFYPIERMRVSRKYEERNLFILDDDSSKNLIEKHTISDEYIEKGSKIFSNNLNSAIQSLTYKQRKIILLIYVKELSIKEVAELLNSTPQNISQIHRKSLKKIKKSLDKAMEVC